jgi:hypothetical protein
MPNGRHPARTRLLICLLPLMGLVGCKNMGDGKSQEEKDEAMLSAAEESGRPIMARTSGVDLSFLLSMDYKEAKSISAQNVEMASGAKIAAESVEILKTNREGEPRKVRAKGKVFVETGTEDGAKILCQEALVEGNEAILRGKPILQRGGSVLEGLDEDTVFYLMGTRLRVIGLHRITNPTAMVASHSGSDSLDTGSGSATRYPNVVTKLPDLGPWTGGPNPLLPPLTENAVPRDIRAEMQRAAEAEAVLQQNKSRADELPDAPPAPWIKTRTTQTNSDDEKPAETEDTESKSEPTPKQEGTAVSMRR